MAASNNNPTNRTGRTAQWSNDFGASIVVFLVALPLCIGIAVASGLDPAAGIISGIVGGIVVGSLGGSSLQVSGPAAGLTLIVWQLVHRHGASALAAALLIAGAVQIAGGLLRVGRYFRAVSPSVVEGMLAAIGVSIVASQMHLLMDLKPQSSTVTSLLTMPAAAANSLRNIPDATHTQAVLIGICTLLAMVAWQKVAIGRLRLFPAALAGVVVGTIAAACAGWSIHFITIPENFAQAVQLPGTDLWQHLANGQVIWAGVSIALVASTSSMLCAASIDKFHSGPRTNYDRELAAQGIGNVICALLGGLPLAGVIVRSSANLEAGAKTRASAIAHGVWMLAVVCAAPTVLRFVPSSALAAVLVYSGFKLISFKVIRALWKQGTGEVLVYGVTVVAVVATDLLTGVAIGLSLSGLRVLYTLSHLDIQVSVCKTHGDDVLRLSGTATFVRLPQLASVLESSTSTRQVRIDLSGLHFIDDACRQLLSDWERQQVAAGRSVTVHHTPQAQPVLAAAVAV